MAVLFLLHYFVKKEGFGTFVEDIWTDYVGGDDYVTNNRNPNDCLKKCESDKDCKRVTIDRHWGGNLMPATCFYKTSNSQDGRGGNLDRFSFTKDKAVGDKKPYVTYPATNIKTQQIYTSTDNKTDCQAMCDRIENCGVMITSSYSDNYCELRYSDGVNARSTDGNWVSHVKKPLGFCPDKETPKVDQEGSNCNRVFSTPLVQVGLNFGKNDIYNFQYTNPYECFKACKSEKECKGFTMLQNNSWCFLKSETNEKYRALDSNSWIMSDFGYCMNSDIIKLDKNGTNCALKSDKKPEVNYPGNDIFHMYENNEAECEKTAKFIPGAQGYTYNVSGRHCYIKSKMENPKRDGDCKSGFVKDYGMCPDKTTPKENEKGSNCFGLCPDKKTMKIDDAGSNCNIKYSVPRSGVAFSGFDIIDYQDSNPEDCEVKCKSNPDCKSFAIDDGSKTACYLKDGVGPPESDSGWSNRTVAPFGLCSDQTTTKLDQEGSNCTTGYASLPKGICPSGNEFLYHFPKSSQADCAAACNSEKDCASYIMENDHCYLKTNKTPLFNFKNEWTAKIKAPFGLCPDEKSLKQEAAGENCSEIFEKKSATNIVGKDLYDFVTSEPDDKAKSVEECAVACRSQKECNGFVMGDDSKRCYIKSSVDPQEGNVKWDSYIKQNYGMCGNGVTPKQTAQGEGCFGMCPDGKTFKKDAADTCFGTCPADKTVSYKYKTNVSDTCYMRCPSDKTTSDEYRKNPDDRCYGECPTDKTVDYVYKQQRADNCYGACPSGISGYKKNKDDTCSVYGDCPEDKTVDYVSKKAADDACYGECPSSSSQKYKRVKDDNCFNKCPDGSFKKDAEDTCFGTCPIDKTVFYQYKTTADDMCYGRCPDGLDGFKKTRDDTCVPAPKPVVPPQAPAPLPPPATQQAQPASLVSSLLAHINFNAEKNVVD
jgi:hypothetical protein